MPRVESATNTASRAKSTPPGSSSPPTSPHRARLPATPTAVSRPNPLDPQRSTAGSKRATTDEPAADPSASGKGSQTLSPARVGLAGSTSGSKTAPAPPAASSENESKAESKAKEEPDKPPVDMSAFEQILELDEEDDRSFSKGIVDNYLDQVVTTFKDMDAALKLEAKGLKELSDLGHFLKGSSAALGVYKVQATCETIQNAGKLRGEGSENSITEEEALKRIATLVERVKVEYKEAERWFKDFYPEA